MPQLAFAIGTVHHGPCRLPVSRPDGIGVVCLKSLHQEQQSDEGHHYERQPHVNPRP